ncbi:PHOSPHOLIPASE A2-like protein 2-RELATED [Salix purpurea]|uniref:phospholipase A2 n=1 Tax=Salix purpurea TaxID=77065 RepID=A0A9Q0Q4B6_SALPP|nr:PHOSPHOLIPASE A2-like protein 2-RELATED [Salix purpurea]
MAKDYQNYSSRLSLLVSCSLLVLLPFSSFHVQALNIGVQAADSAISLVWLFDHLSNLHKPLCNKLILENFFVFPQGKGCSRKCESEFCSVPPFLRYGKYCGLLYSGCPGEKPCDGLDACCMKHDACIQAKNNDYLSQECSQKFISCMNKFKTGARTFKGNKCKVNEVIDVISVVMEAALLAGRALHKP